VFQAAHRLAISVYKETRDFPRDEWYGLRAQLRRAAVSTVSNIVEGNARRGALEYVNFLNIARGSAAEAAYLVCVASELGYFSVTAAASLQQEYEHLIPQLENLVQKMRRLATEPTKDQRRKTKD
jgi:four helix bundle protein